MRFGKMPQRAILARRNCVEILLDERCGAGGDQPGRVRRVFGGRLTPSDAEDPQSRLDFIVTIELQPRRRSAAECAMAFHLGPDRSRARRLDARRHRCADGAGVRQCANRAGGSRDGVERCGADQHLCDGRRLFPRLPRLAQPVVYETQGGIDRGRRRSTGPSGAQGRDRSRRRESNLERDRAYSGLLEIEVRPKANQTQSCSRVNTPFNVDGRPPLRCCSISSWTDCSIIVTSSGFPKS